MFFIEMSIYKSMKNSRVVQTYICVNTTIISYDNVLKISLFLK